MSGKGSSTAQAHSRSSRHISGKRGPPASYCRSTPVWHLSFTWKPQAVSRPFMQYVHEPSLPEGLNPGRDDRALALAVPPAALPGLSPACGLVREVWCGLAREVWCGASAHAPTHRLISGTRAKCRVPQACLGDKAGARSALRPSRSIPPEPLRIGASTLFGWARPSILAGFWAVVVWRPCLGGHSAALLSA